MDTKIHELESLQKNLSNHVSLNENENLNMSPIRVNLPKLQLQIFSGDSIKWREF